MPETVEAQSKACSKVACEDPLSPQRPKILDLSTRLSQEPAEKTGNGLRVKTQRVKPFENFSEESNLLQRFRRHPDILYNPIKAISSIF